VTDTERLLRRGLLLEYLTLGWNVAGTIVVITVAAASHSIAMAGFGLDSLIEIGASIVVVWQLKGVASGRERRALRFIAWSFFALAAYVSAQSAHALLMQIRPNSSWVGVAWLASTFAAMMSLAAQKERTGTKLGNPVLMTEARVTRVDAYLAGSVLVGVILDAQLGWWWADPASGLVIVLYALKEGRHAWREAGELAPTVV